MPRSILVTPRSLTSTPHRLVERLRDFDLEIVYGPAGRLPSETELIALVRGCEGWLAGVEPVSDRVIEAADCLRIIARNGTGIDNLPLATLEKRGIQVATAAGANARGVAELALALVLAGLRHVPRTDAGIKQGAWPRHNGREIDGARVGIVGCGAVGALLAQMCDQLGADVVGFDPREPNVGLRGGRLTYAALPELLAACDIVSLHCPMPPDGRAIVTRELLANAPSGAIIVNTARAALVDQDAVLGALDDGRLSAYATDVFDTEPPSDLRLARHPSVIATSHIGGLTIESVERATQMATDSILAALLPAQRGA